MVLAYVPAMHGMGVVAPSTQKWPGTHSSQAVEPLDSWNVPGLHAGHSGVPASAAKLPRGHSFGCDVPPAHWLPAAQSTHSPLLELK